VVDLPDDAGTARVIAGEYGGRRGPALTFSPVDVWDLRLRQGRIARFELPEGRTLAFVILHGSVRINGSEVAREAQVVQLDRAGTTVSIEAETDASVLLLSGEPLNEPIAGYGPFVMNSEQEISEAIDDFNAGRFGRIPPENRGSRQA
jgi:redox-sensitive bicupin YhaK (pirin superfamily)